MPDSAQLTGKQELEAKMDTLHKQLKKLELTEVGHERLLIAELYDLTRLRRKHIRLIQWEQERLHKELARVREKWLPLEEAECTEQARQEAEEAAQFEAFCKEMEAEAQETVNE